jgi:MFS family permease
MGWKVFPPHRWVAISVLFWGTVSSVQAACTTWAGLMVCRFLLAIPEAMYGPAVPLYLSFFYPRERLGLRVGLFLSGSALANAYGGALAYGISQARGAIAPWRILFLIEGMINYSSSNLLTYPRSTNDCFSSCCMVLGSRQSQQSQVSQ